IKIGNQRNRNPVIIVHVAVAGNYRPHLLRSAAPKLRRGLRANARKINGGMSGWVHCPEEAIRLLHQQRSLCGTSTRQKKLRRKGHEDKCKCAAGAHRWHFDSWSVVCTSQVCLKAPKNKRDCVRL